MNKNPFEQFSDWYSQAPQLPINEPLSSLWLPPMHESAGVRTVLLKHYDDAALFFTVISSVAKCSTSKKTRKQRYFFIGCLRAPNRIEGRVEQISDTEADALIPWSWQST